MEQLKTICDGCKELKDEMKYAPVTYIDGLVQAEKLCYDCCETQGFCWGCGVFCGGLSSFENCSIGAYCNNCADEIRSNDELKFSDDYCDFDDDDDEINKNENDK